MNKDISSEKVFDDKNSKTEKDEEKGLFNVMEDNMEVENLSEKVTEGSGYDEGIVDNDVELETVREDDLGETNSLDQEGSILKVLKQ